MEKNKCHVNIRSISLFLLCLLMLSGSAAQRAMADSGKKGKDPGSSVSASLERARKEGKFLMILFYEKNDEKTGKMRSAMNAASGKSGQVRALFTEVNVNNKNENAAIAKYEINKVKKPVILVIASDGTIIRGFSEQASPAELEKAFVSDKMVKLLKAMQEKKPVIVSFMNKDFKNYQKSVQEVEASAKDVKGCVLIKADPKDEKDRQLLEQFNLKAGMSENTVMILDRGSLLGKLTGDINRNKIKSSFNCGCSSG